MYNKTTIRLFIFIAAFWFAFVAIGFLTNCGYDVTVITLKENNEIEFDAAKVDTAYVVDNHIKIITQNSDTLIFRIK